jgi:hypothetical protein
MFLTHLIKPYQSFSFSNYYYWRPNTDVTALIGSVISPPGTCDVTDKHNTRSKVKKYSRIGCVVTGLKTPILQYEEPLGHKGNRAAQLYCQNTGSKMMISLVLL